MPISASVASFQAAGHIKEKRSFSHFFFNASPPLPLLLLFLDPNALRKKIGAAGICEKSGKATQVIQTNIVRETRIDCRTLGIHSVFVTVLIFKIPVVHTVLNSLTLRQIKQIF